MPNTQQSKIVMIKILIIEDDYIWQIKLEMMLSGYSQFKITGYAENVTKARQIIELSKPDIIIADLFLGRENVLESMIDIFNIYPTLFLSSHQEEECFRAIVNYPVSAFLVKPFHDFSLLSSLFYLGKHCTQMAEESKFLTFRGFKSGVAKVMFANITKIVAEGNYSIFSSSDGRKYARKISLKTVLKSLDERFLRISKTTVVNLNHISKVDFPDKIVYLNNETYCVGRSYVKKLKDFKKGF